MNGPSQEFEQLKDEFLSAVGHELRTPLTSVQATLKLLGSGVIDPASDKGRQLLTRAIVNGDRLQKLVEGLMDVNRLRSGRIVLEKEQCDLQSLMVNTLARVGPRLGQRRLTTSGAAGRIWVDPGRMVDILEKLLDNAIRFSADGTDIAVSIHRDGQFVTFSVQDQGVGIAAHQLEQIFEGFGLLDGTDTRRPGGTGLSLGICRYVVRQHGGRMWAESNPGSGSTFLIVLPAPNEQPLLEDVESVVQLIDNIRDVFWMLDLQRHQVVYVSPAYEEIWGRSQESLYADPKSWLEAIHEEDRELVRRANEAMLHTSYRMTYRVVRPDGTIRWVKDRGYPVRTEFGDVQRVVGIAEDITEQHLLSLDLEKRVAERTAELMAIFDAAPEAAVFTDPQRRARMCNKAFLSLYGYEMEEVVGQSMAVFYADAAEFEKQGQLRFNAARDCSIQTFESELMHKSGERIPVELTATRVFAADGAHLGSLSLSRDLRPRRKLEQQMQQARRLEAAGQLAGGLAHEFNNMLTVINGYTQLLLADLDLRDPRRDPLREIAEASERATALTGQLLTFSRCQVVRPEALDLGALLARSRGLLQRVLGEDVALQMRLEEGPLPVWADRGQLEQVLLNLAGNARDAMARGGSLTVEATETTLSQPLAVSAAVLPPGAYVLLTVTDTGAGMEAGVQARLFEPFFTTKAPGLGTGLGLAAVYGIVAEAQGGIAVQSSPEQGTSFRVYLPRLAAAPPGGSTADLPVGGETILLVEDEVKVRRFVRLLLERHGYVVLEAADGQQGLEAMLASDRPIDLLITDVVMPRMSGQELAEQVQAVRPGARILFMSGYLDDKGARYGVQRDDVHFIRKPLVTASFLQKVQEVLAKAS